jgi:hypothetical protein
MPKVDPTTPATACAAVDVLARPGHRPTAEQGHQRLVARVPHVRQRAGQAAGPGELAEELGLVAGAEGLERLLGAGLVPVAPVDPVLLAALLDPHDGVLRRLGRLC